VVPWVQWGTRAGLTVELLDTEKELKKIPDLLLWGDTVPIALLLIQAQRSRQPCSQATLSQATTWQQEMNS